jgi:hypothetical protein
MIECEQPTTDLYTFVGRIHLYLTEESSALLRGQSTNSVAMSQAPSYESSLNMHRSADMLIPPSENGSPAGHIREITKSLAADNVLLRGSRLKNTQFVFGEISSCHASFKCFDNVSVH